MTAETNFILTANIFKIQRAYHLQFPHCITSCLAILMYRDATYCFHNNQRYLVKTISDLIRFSRNDLMKFKGIGKKRIEEIEKWLAYHDICLNPNDQIESIVYNSDTYPNACEITFRKDHTIITT